jgi:hypothetical protein
MEKDNTNSKSKLTHKGIISLISLVVGIIFWIVGDGSNYNGLLVLFGWVFVILAGIIWAYKANPVKKEVPKIEEKVADKNDAGIKNNVPDDWVIKLGKKFIKDISIKQHEKKPLLYCVGIVIVCILLSFSLRSLPINFLNNPYAPLAAAVILTAGFGAGICLFILLFRIIIKIIGWIILVAIVCGLIALINPLLAGVSLSTVIIIFLLYNILGEMKKTNEK